MLTKSNWRPCLSPVRPEANAPEKPIKSSVIHPGTHHHLSLWKKQNNAARRMKIPCAGSGASPGTHWDLSTLYLRTQEHHRLHHRLLQSHSCPFRNRFMDIRDSGLHEVMPRRKSQEEKDLKCKKTKPTTDTNPNKITATRSGKSCKRNMRIRPDRWNLAFV